MKDYDYCISSGEFAQLCQTTRETLRYYHEKGLLIPYRNPHNGYYYYSPIQLTSFYFIHTFRELGTPSGELCHYLEKPNGIPIERLVEDQYNSLLREQQELNRKFNTINIFKMLLDSIHQTGVEKPSVCTLPPTMNLLITPVSSKNANSLSEIVLDLKNHVTTCKNFNAESFPVGISFKSENFFNEIYSYENVFSFTNSLNNSSSDNNMLFFGGRRAVVSIYHNNAGELTEFYNQLTTFLKENEIVPTSDIYSMSIINILDSFEQPQYLKYIFVCID